MKKIYTFNELINLVKGQTDILLEWDKGVCLSCQSNPMLPKYYYNMSKKVKCNHTEDYYLLTRFDLNAILTVADNRNCEIEGEDTFVETSQYKVDDNDNINKIYLIKRIYQKEDGTHFDVIENTSEKILSLDEYKYKREATVNELKELREFKRRFTAIPSFEDVDNIKLG